VTNRTTPIIGELVDPPPERAERKLTEDEQREEIARQLAARDAERRRPKP
jgi:hypothetical protein